MAEVRCFLPAKPNEAYLAQGPPVFEISHLLYVYQLAESTQKELSSIVHLLKSLASPVVVYYISAA